MANYDRSLRKPAELLMLVLFLCYVQHTTATTECCFVKWNIGSIGRMIHDVRHQPHLQHRCTPSKRDRSKVRYGTSSSATTNYVNHNTYRFHYNPYMNRYPKIGTFAIDTAAQSSRTMSSTAIGTVATMMMAASGNGIVNLTRIMIAWLHAKASITVVMTLLSSALCGSMVDQQKESNDNVTWKKFLPPSILVTLVTSTAFVFLFRRILLFQLPQHHFIYDYCWSTLLPSSLSLLLFSLPTPSNAKHQSTMNSTLIATNSTITEPIQAQQSSVVAIRRLAVPFLIASIGSIMGCLISFVLCYYYPTPLLSVPDARAAVSCLCASFIGGSINFFATSVIIQQQSPQLNILGGGNYHSLLSAMAAVDIVIMAFYFTVLSAALQSQRLHRWFKSSEAMNDDDDVDADDKVERRATKDYATTAKLLVVNPKIEPIKDKDAVAGAHKFNLISAVISIAALNLLLVEVSKRMELFVAKRLSVPGTACAILAIMVPWISTQLSEFSPLDTLWKSMQQCAKPMSRLAFLLVFATMGCTIDLSTALYNGPACLFVSFAALIIHGIVALFGSYLFQRLMKATAIDLTDVLIASNAAIGGPATAAAFCGNIKMSRDSVEKRNITIAATVWGVVGYAIGTTIGVTMFRMLQYLA